LAATFFLLNGCNVYRPANQHTSVDLLVEREGTYKRIQVKAARYTPKHKHPCCDVGDPSTYDTLFVSAPNGDCWLIPSEDIVAKSLRLGPTWDRWRFVFDVVQV
jgi:hypothetical protein